jgi:MFS family permease
LSRPEVVTPDDRRRRQILVVTLTGVAASTFPITIFSASLPEVADDLDTSLGVISWVLAGPLLALALATPLGGKLGDLIGHRRTYLAGFGAATVLALATSLAWSAGWLIAIRTAGQAMGAFTGPAALAILMQTFPREERARALSWWSAVSAISPTLGTVVGGFLIEATSWRLIFVIQGLASLLALVPAYRLLPETPRRRDVSFDLAGAVLLALGVGALLLAINRVPALGWAHPLVIGGFVAGPLLLTLFVQVERRVDEPLLPLRYLRRPGFTLPTASNLFSQGSYSGTMVVTPFLFSRVFGYGTDATALILASRAIAYSVGSWAGGRSEARLGVRTVAVGGSVIAAAGVALTGIGGTTEAVVLVVVALFASGFGQGAARPSLMASVGNSVGDANLGVASGAFTMVGQVGASATITILTALVGTSVSPNRFLAVYLVAAAICAISGVLLLGLRPNRNTGAEPRR